VKKLLVVCGFALLGLQNASAQSDSWAPQNIAIGVGVGTTGISIDASTTFSTWLGLRAGVDIMPGIKINKSIDLGIQDKTQGKTVAEMNKYIDDLNARIDNYNAMPGVTKIDKVDRSLLPERDLPNKLDLQGKLSNTTGHVLIDVYPIPGFSFHATVGAYFGPSKIISVYNKPGQEGLPEGLTPISQWNNAIIAAKANPTSLLYTQVVQPNKLDMIGAELGDYFITPNPAENGNVEANIKVNGFRPYVGIGFGRAVPKSRLGVQVDLGCQFWGKPKVYIPTYNKDANTYQNEQIDAERAGDDAGKILKIVSKFSVYPTLNIRLVGRIL